MDLKELTRIRAQTPGRIAEAWAARTRRGLLGADQRLLIVAADHPARGVLGIRGESGVMNSRADLLARLLEALTNPLVDGVLGTADVLDDLLLLGALEGKVVIGSMNRGGLQGASFELDDRFTGYRAVDIARQGLDGGKMLTRIALDDAGSVSTMEASARAIDELSASGLMALVEPFISVRVDEGERRRVENQLDPDSVIKSIQVASGLGGCSAHTWLKLPIVDDFARVMEATTLPTLILGGDPHGTPEVTYTAWQEAMNLAPVRGLVVGRALLYPERGGVCEAVATATEIVHGGQA